MNSRSRRADERMFWVLESIVKRRYNGMVAWDEEVVDAFVAEFPEAAKSLRIYTLGPNSCPMLNRAAKRAEQRGYLSPGSVGNMDARSFNQRTWCRYWSITDAGRTALEEANARSAA